MKTRFPIYTQLDAMDCGPTCLQMISAHHGKYYSLQSLRKLSNITREGVSLSGVSEAAEEIGLQTLGVRIDFDTLKTKAPLPAIVHWDQEHFVVVYKCTSKKVHVADPAHGDVVYSPEEFIKSWCSDEHEGQQEGIALLMETTPEFYAQEGEKISRKNFSYFFQYLKKYRSYMVQLILGLFLGALLELIFPFLTQTIVDFGIGTRNIGFIYLILAAQLMVFLGNTTISFIRSWILLHVSTRFNISFISDFLLKLMKLPISFFDSKMVGDLIQRIGDHRRIEEFLTQSGLNTLFSSLNIVVISFVLAYYSMKIFWIFLIGTLLYVGWILLFLRKRRELDYKSFAKMSANQSKTIELLKGIQEIKLNNIERQQRWQWENIQAGLFQVNIKLLTLGQYQQAGSSFFLQCSHILITFTAALEVIKGNMTLGMMLAISYLLGQLSGPINQLIQFIRDFQDAKISLERLGEIHDRENEELTENGLLELIPESKDITIENLNFHYAGFGSPRVLEDIKLNIPEGKTTAIVGMSGSGKTTLIKLLLKFYSPTEGQIFVSRTPLNQIKNSTWRRKCGVVMQDSYIFSESIAYNIALEEDIDKARLLKAVQTANIQYFIEGLPMGYNTKIGDQGIGLSAGQRQRLLIARAVYKDPEYIFFDEATNALDANNELIIMNNLNTFFKGRTVVIVAHRLSTVKNADQIIVLKGGKIIEQGSHQTLVNKKGAYFQLVSNQLELGQ
ncbi:MAG: peptidase domain-containing ABC transporter [Bacteroidia bacterium]|nr:peptidase domain-containing ABC transporter [Bacteroidia bacterium]